VTLAAYQEYAANLQPQQWQEYRRNILDTLNEARPELQLVAELNGEIVGSVLIVPAEPVMEVLESTAMHPGFQEVRLLAVTPAVRGQGIGKALMLTCIERAHSAGENAITLHTSDLMQTAKNMYERMGFKRDPKMDYYPSEDIVVKGYRLELG
jgi:ribosomal protein S18 acetylase RimI-like enzyme